MSFRSLPSRPNLDQLRIQANELHRAHREGDRSAAARIAAHHPEMRRLSLQEVLDRPLALADAQLVLAREYGFHNWAELKRRVELSGRLGEIAPHPRFSEALAALDAGDIERLRELIASDPTIVQARTNLGPPYGYFTGATLLHHVAGNPGRDHPLPKNIVEIARLLLDEGADVNASTLGPSPGSSPDAHGATTMALVVTSAQASDMDVSGPLIDLLLERGATLDLTGDGALDPALANHAPRAAEKMIELGARPDVLAAAALGRMHLLRSFFDNTGRLRSRPRRQGKEMSERDAIGLAMLYAYVRGEREAVDFLVERNGNWGIIGVNNGTALHRAAWAGDLDMVRRLVAKGADVNNRENPFRSTPMAWASHNNQTHVVEWLRKHAAIDLYDAVVFGFGEEVEARLREDPSSVSTRLDDREIPQGTPLHAAARWNREDLAKILLERGAEPNALAGNGLTPLDIAEAHGAIGIAALLERHGGTRTTAAAKTSSDPRVKPFERVASDIVQVVRSGDAGAAERIQDFFNRTVAVHDILNVVQRRLQKGKPADISISEARDVVAGLRGFASWAAFAESVTRPDGLAQSWAVPLYRIDEKRNMIQVRRSLDEGEWDAIISVMEEKKIDGLDAGGQMTDAVMKRVAQLDDLIRLDLGGSKRLTDAGLTHLARLPRLQRLDLSGCAVSDRGLQVLRELPNLRSFHLHWHRAVSDAGLANLAFCDNLERVDLLGSPAGDGAIDALAGKPRLRHLNTGSRVTDSALPLFRRYPMFKTWQGGDPSYSLVSFEAEPNHLLIDGPFTNKGLAYLAGLDGLFGLSFFRHSSAITSEGLRSLADLAHLGFLGCGGELCDDGAMRLISAMPRLGMLMCQGTVATDAGFAALSRSRSVEHIWGRECPNLTGHGFAAMSSMASLRGLAVSCKNVDDAALSTLPRFPALRDFVAMDVADAGFRHVGRCEQLEALWCMYCRDTTDAATEHIADLPRLKTYYAGQTRITDRSLEILARMPSLERLEFWNCAGITDAGVAFLAALPRLREIKIESCRQVTPRADTLFPAQVRVTYSSP